MSKVIDGSMLFQNTTSEIKSLEDTLQYYENFLLLYEGIEGYNKYYLTFHEGLSSLDEFVNIPCPHCGTQLNENSMTNHKVWVHGKQNADSDLDNRANWGILEALCPNCGDKTVVILE